MDIFTRESGKHVVQRVPETETRGRRHTSVVSVAVTTMNEISADVGEIQITRQRLSQGAGGQNTNKVESGIRARHLETGLEVTIGGVSQCQNLKRALEVLKGRVLDQRKDKAHANRRNAVVEQIGGCQRGGKIRTYDFIRGQVTNHLTGKTSNKVKEIMKGNFDLI